MDELKLQIIQKGVKQLLDEAKVPQRVHLQVVKALSDRMAEHKRDMQSHQEVLQKHQSYLKDHERQIQEWDALQEKLTSIERLKGDPGIQGERGTDGVSPDIQEVIDSVLSLIQLPKDGEDGQPGADAVVDEEKIISSVIERIQKEQSLDLSHIKGAQTFLKDGIKYRVEELMHGSGKATAGGLSVITVLGTIDDSNVTFTAASQPTLLNINGGFYQKSGGSITWSYAAGTITLSSPVGTNGSIYGI